MQRLPRSFLLAALAAAPLSAQLVVPSSLYPTVQSAIDAVTPNGTILVLAGTYNENLDCKGKAFTLRAVSGPMLTILNGGATAPVIAMRTGETRSTIVEGFTIKNGKATVPNTSGTPLPVTGGGIQLWGASPTIRKCWIRENTTAAYGAGIGGTPSTTAVAPLIEDCRIDDNLAQGLSYASGAGVGILGFSTGAVAGVPEIRRCSFVRNVAQQRGAGAYFGYNQSALIEDCVFTANATIATGTSLEGGGAIFYGLNSVGIVRNCRIFGNSSGGNGGGVKYFNVTGLSLVNNTIANNTGGGIAGFANTGAFGINVSANLRNCILWNNSGGEVALTGLGQGSIPPTVTIDYSVVTGGYAGTGNLASDPLLANGLSDNLRLLPGSPAIDKGDNAAANLPARDFEGDPRQVGPAVDIGADEHVPGAVLLYGSRGTISLAAPGTTTFTLNGGSGRAGMAYAILMGFSGTYPGVDLLGLHLPLNIDPALTLGITAFPSFQGSLSGSGIATATMPLGAGPLPPGLLTEEMSFAAVVLGAGPSLNAFSNDETHRFAQ
ncbi:MAG: hypothetical protein IT458_17450 [Planctomycetes bacterium]|nr:hypothetical protein [Planctomycetota bacterium]